MSQPQPLVLETRAEIKDETVIVKLGEKLGTTMIAPVVSPTYWMFRVQLSPTQAILGFPKYGIIGIGFAQEDADWNLNLPAQCDAELIYDHIAENKGDDSITRERCIEAIKMVQAAAVKFRETAGHG